MNSIKVSIIVPVYNVEAYLERCLESLVHQTLQEIEIIVVNDGSPDNSQQIIDRYTAGYPGKVVGLVKPNGGLSDARNFGVPYAKGEYLAFVDSDDYVDITMYEKMYEKAQETDSDIVTCGYFGINEATDSYSFLQRGKMIHFGQSIYEDKELLPVNAPYAWNKIFRRSMWMNSGLSFPKGMIYEDIATVYPMFMHANRISKVNEALYYYILQREGAITATYSDKILQMFDSLGLMNRRFQENGKFDEFKEVLEFINLRHALFRFRDFPKYKDHKLQKKIVDTAFAHLNRYFRKWNKNEMFLDTYFKGKTLQKLIWNHKLTWYLYGYIPSALLKSLGKSKKVIKVGKKALHNPNYVNRYRYAAICKHTKIKENQVLFESFHGKTINDSPFAMMLELAKDPSFKIYYTTGKNLKADHQKVLDSYGIKNVTLVTLGSRKYQYVLATSKYLVTNVSFPPYYMKREGQICMNTWHGTPLKTLGKQMLNGIQDMSNMQRNFLHSTYLLHPNHYTMDHMMEDYNMNHLFTGKVLCSGYPRNTVFSDQEAAARVREKYGMGDKEVYAYMPTWRGAMSSSARFNSYEEEVQDLLTSMDKGLKDNQILYVNLHSLVKDKVSIDEYEHIKPFPKDIDNYAFLNAVDVLITDYSSVFFDFSITRKPVVLFMYDYEEYMAERGMYMDVKDLPFEQIYSMEALVEYFAKTDKNLDTEFAQWKKYVETFIANDDIENSRKLVDYMFYGKEAAFEVFDYSDNKDIPHVVYLADKVTGRKAFEKLKRVDDLQNPVGVFLRRDFTPYTLEILAGKYNSSLDYIVPDVQMHMTLGENVLVFLDRITKRFSCDKVYRRELQRILPGLNIVDIVAGRENYRNQCLIHAFKAEKKQ